MQRSVAKGWFKTLSLVKFCEESDGLIRFSVGSMVTESQFVGIRKGCECIVQLMNLAKNIKKKK